jgi:hypothetical protein
MPCDTSLRLVSLAATNCALVTAAGYITMPGQPRGRSEHLQILLSPEEAAALDSFRFRNQLPTRLSAVHELLKRGLGLDQPKRNGVLRAKDFAITRPVTKAWRRP